MNSRRVYQNITLSVAEGKIYRYILQIYIYMSVKSVKLLRHVRLFAIPWTVAYQAPLSMEFSRQEYWSGLPFPFPGDLPNPRIESRSPILQADALLSELPGLYIYIYIYIYICNIYIYFFFTQLLTDLYFNKPFLNSKCI